MTILGSKAICELNNLQKRFIFWDRSSTTIECNTNSRTSCWCKVQHIIPIRGQHRYLVYIHPLSPSCVHAENNRSFHTETFMLSAHRAVMASASRRPIRCPFFWHFCIFCVQWSLFYLTHILGRIAYGKTAREKEHHRDVNNGIGQIK
jgi:hypothetical protein